MERVKTYWIAGIEGTTPPGYHEYVMFTDFGKLANENGKLRETLREFCAAKDGDANHQWWREQFEPLLASTSETEEKP